MVAINLQLRHIKLYTTTILLSTIFTLSTYTASCEVLARIPALEGDVTYMSLLSQEATLINQKDSLSTLLADYREKFASGGADANESRNAIVNIEMELFDIRGKESSVSEKIANIEQEWRLKNGEVTITTTSAESADSAKTIATSKIARESLPQGDYENLLNAEGVEAECANAYAEYMSIYSRMSELLQLYNQTDDEEVATEYSDEFYTLSQSAESLYDILNQNWERAYDNKDFAYKMLMEVLGYNDILDQSDEINRECESHINATESGSTNIAAVKYNFQKRGMLEIESLFANKLHLNGVIDSLNVATKSLSKMQTFDELPELVFVKRSFLLYEPILFSSAAVYDSSNPIPETVIYNKGTIYRIQYGAFKVKQAPSIFHGSYPISYEMQAGFWTYYGGGYATYTEAEEAMALCKSKGFKRPEIVRWRDGERRNLSRDPLPMDQKYRIQITGITEITESVKSVIEIHCADAELSKTGAESYVIGPIIGQIKVEEFTQALEDASRDIMTNIIEIE